MTFKTLARWSPVAIILIMVTLFFTTGLHNTLSMAFLKKHIVDIQAYCSENSVMSLLMMVGLYTLIVIVPTPLPGLMNMLLGFLFPFLLASITASFCEALGGVLLLLAVRSSFGQLINTSSAPKIKKLAENMDNHAWTYISILRLSTLFPSSAINIAAGISPIDPKRYFIITLISSLPAAGLLAYLGKGLNRLLLSKEPVSILSLVDMPTIVVLSSFILLIIGANVYWRKKNEY